MTISRSWGAVWLMTGLTGLTGLMACGGESASTADAGDAGAETITPPKVPLATSLTIEEVAAYQTIRLDWMTKGVATPPGTTLPILRGKPALVRAFVRLVGTKKWIPREIEAELHLTGDVEQTITDRRVIGAASTEDVLASTFDFTLDEKALGAATSFFLVVRDPAEKDPNLGQIRIPKTGAVLPETQQAVGPLRVVVVPVNYLADGVPKLPHTAPQDLAVLHDYLFDMYPVSGVEVTLHAPMDFSPKITADGGGWAWLLNTLMNLRAADAPPKDTYYLAAVTPTSSWPDYCGNGCVAGMAPSVASVTAIGQRAVASLAFGGDTWGSTSAHELGHAHGRAHAPCGNPYGIDQTFPYSGGASGVPGYRLSSGTLEPDSVDIMSYCTPTWISDYNYGALLTRVRAVAAQDAIGQVPEHRYARYVVDAAGNATLGGVFRDGVPDEPPETRVLRVDGASRAMRGWFAPFDHAGGGFFYVER